MKKILTLIIFASLFVSINAYSIESGHQIKDSEGNKMYFSLKQNRYIYCKDFVLEGSVIIDSGFTITPVCDENDLSLSYFDVSKVTPPSKFDKLKSFSSQTQYQLTPMESLLT